VRENEAARVGVESPLSRPADRVPPGDVRALYGERDARGRTSRRAVPRRSWSPFLWLLFSAGGTVAALLYPVHLFLTAFALPLGWMEAPSHRALLGLVRHPLARAYLLVLISVPLFHFAHRFRYTLYDGLQLKHLARPIAVLCYGAALAGTLVGGYVVLGL
jgi:fumarate reductase subunit D